MTMNCSGDEGCRTTRCLRIALCVLAGAAALGLATSMGVAVPTGLGGTVVALQGASTIGPTFAALMTLGGVVAAFGALAAGRISPRR